MFNYKVIWRVIAVVGLSIAFFLVAFQHEKLVPISLKIRERVLARRTKFLDKTMYFTHVLNGGLFMSALTALVALVQGFRWGQWKQAFLMTAAMLLQTAFVQATKILHRSERPPQIIADFLMKTYSYPSGHTAASTTFALVVSYFLFLNTSLWFAVPLSILLFVNALATSYGRLYLDMHWFTDLIGGWLMALITFLGMQIIFFI